MKKQKHPFKNLDNHIQYVKSLPCVICEAGFSSTHKIVQAHHLLKPWVGTRGMSMKADDRNIIPLCLHHHQILHTKYGSEKLFFESFGLPADYGKQYAKSLWEGKITPSDDDLPF